MLSRKNIQDACDHFFKLHDEIFLQLKETISIDNAFFEDVNHLILSDIPSQEKRLLLAKYLDRADIFFNTMLTNYHHLLPKFDELYDRALSAAKIETELNEKYNDLEKEVINTFKCYDSLSSVFDLKIRQPFTQLNEYIGDIQNCLKQLTITKSQSFPEVDTTSRLMMFSIDSKRSYIVQLNEPKDNNKSNCHLL